MALTETDREEIQLEPDTTDVAGAYRAQLLENVVISDEEAEVALTDVREEDWSDDLFNREAYKTITAETPDTFRAGISSVGKSPCLSSDNTGGTASGGGAGGSGGGAGGSGGGAGGSGGGAGGSGGGAGGADGGAGGADGGAGDGPTYNTAGPGWHNVNDLKFGDNGVKALIGFEGLVLTVYDDARKAPKEISTYEEAKGYPTIGIGHLIKANEKEKFRPYLKPGKMTKEQAYALKKSDVPRYTGHLYKKIKQPITQNMFDALTMLSFNTGAGGVTVKKAINLINEKKYKEAGDAITNGTNTSKGKVMAGLTRRRKAEGQLFMLDIPKA